MDLWQHPDFDHHEMVTFCTDVSTGLRAIIAVHNTALGKGMGGCRMQTYGSDHEALTDALRLSRGMTYKYAASGLHHGGAKAVIIASPQTSKSNDLLHSFARFVERLAGEYTTAEDAGIETADVRTFAKTTRYIRNLPLDDTGDGALCTAWGVLHGIRAGLQFAGSREIRGSRIAVEGLGKVGMALCDLLHQEGADLIVYDTDREKVETASKRFGANVAGGGEIHSVSADVYSPCALGGILSAATIPHIKAGVIAGAANNQLLSGDADGLMRDRGILYCPDYIVNAGGVLSVASPGSQYDRTSALHRVAGIEKTTLKVFERAKKRNQPTGFSADELARERLVAAAGQAAENNHV